MRSGGINWLAVLVAAVAVYAIGFVIYGLLIPEETWMAMSGMSEDQKAVAMSRMVFSPVMPVLTAAFLAILFKFGQVASAAKGAQWAAVVALASAIPTMLYGWVYGGIPTEMTAIDSAHLMLGHVTAGAILGGWR
jgi:predicted membrane channel-forming protein YqfA (hemolysin III family)